MGTKFGITFASMVALAALSAPGAARADGADVEALKAQAAALEQQNDALEQRLDKLERKQAAQSQAAAVAPGSADMAQVVKGPVDLLAGDGPLTFHGVTLFGTIDAGLGWASFGLPNNGKFYLGDNLISKFATHTYFGLSPDNLAQTTLGVKGATELLPGLSGVFYAATGINPLSGQLANTPGSIVDNNGLNRNAYSNNGDGSRGGQAFNDQLYAGLASKTYGQLTVGRHKSLTNDLVGAYDPPGGGYAFSVIGYSGTPVAGLGDTENSRWDDSLKYRFEYGPAHFGAIYKFADGNGGCNYLGAPTSPKGAVQQCYPSKNDAGQIGAGFTYAAFDVDGVVGYFHQATNFFGPLSAAQAFSGLSTFTPNVGPTVVSTGMNANSAQAIISDNTGWALAGKYTYDQWKFYVGWAHVIYHDPADNAGIGAQNDQGGYALSAVTNGFFTHAKLLDTVWGGARYAYDSRTDIVGAFYVEHQNGFGSSADLATCSLPAYNRVTQAAPRSPKCAGNLYGASAYVDYHFTRRFDVYGGIMFNAVDGGIQSGFYSPTNWAPTVGARFTF